MKEQLAENSKPGKSSLLTSRRKALEALQASGATTNDIAALKHILQYD